MDYDLGHQVMAAHFSTLGDTTVKVHDGTNGHVHHCDLWREEGQYLSHFGLIGYRHEAFFY